MPKRTKKRTTKGRQRDVLVVASKVKAYIKSKKMNTSSDAIATLSEQVYCMIDHAASRTKANGRKTVKGQDV